MEWQLVIPWITPRENLLACLATIKEAEREHVVIVDNSKDAFAISLPGWKVYAGGVNLGYARSINLFLGGCEQTIIASASSRFDDLTAAAKMMGAYDCARDINDGHLISFSRDLVRDVGYWDENFYPIYLDDTDYMRRIELAGYQVKEVVTGTQSAGNNIAVSDSDGPEWNFYPMLEYYKEKWGGGPGEERHALPFSKHPLQYWPSATIEELKERYGLGR